MTTLLLWIEVGIVTCGLYRQIVSRSIGVPSTGTRKESSGLNSVIGRKQFNNFGVNYFIALLLDLRKTKRLSQPSFQFCAHSDADSNNTIISFLFIRKAVRLTEVIVKLIFWLVFATNVKLRPVEDIIETRRW